MSVQDSALMHISAHHSLPHMSREAEHDDLDSRGVVVNWEAEIERTNALNYGSFGAVYEGKLMLDSGGHVDVVVKVSVAVLPTGCQSSQALLNDTLRCMFCLHRKARLVLKRCCKHCH